MKQPSGRKIVLNILGYDFKSVPEWWPRTAHALYVFKHSLPTVYEYDPTDDGPEVRAIPFFSNHPDGARYVPIRGCGWF